MKLETFTYDPTRGWSAEPFPQFDSPESLVVVFGASRFIDHPQPIAELSQAYPNAHMVGCSTSGEIAAAGLSDNGLSVAVVGFDQTHLVCTHAKISQQEDSHQAGTEIAKTLQDPGLAGVLVLSDGLSVNGSQLVKGLNEVLPESVVVTGGLAGDGDRFKQTWVLKNRQPCSGYITAVGFYGDHVRIGHGSKGGWDIFGPERLVTRSQDNILYELDGKPSLELYKRYLGDRASGLPATALLFPLAVRKDRSDEKRVVRTILAVDEDTQSMTFAGDVPQGHLAQLMKANFDRLIDGASDAALMTKRNNGAANGPTLSIAISCVGRRLILGERTEDELESALETLPEGTQQVGFYSYGEISPFVTGHCDLHNQTMTLTTIHET